MPNNIEKRVMQHQGEARNTVKVLQMEKGSAGIRTPLLEKFLSNNYSRGTRQSIDFRYLKNSLSVVRKMEVFLSKAVS